MIKKEFGEIIESSLTQWRGQCWEWDYFPPLGSLVCIKTDHHVLYGIINDVHTGSSDPSREPYAYRKTEEELRQQQPQIFSFLKTTFTCIPLGFKNEQQILYQLPPTPPKIHAFVTHADDQELSTFFAKTDYIHLLAHSSLAQAHIDELLLALLYQLTQHSLCTWQYTEDFIKQYMLITANDYKRTKIMSQRVQELVKRQLPKGFTQITDHVNVLV